MKNETQELCVRIVLGLQLLLISRFNMLASTIGRAYLRDTTSTIRNKNSALVALKISVGVTEVVL